MKAEWQRTTLGAAFTTATGTTPPKSNADYYGQYMPLVKPPELCDAPLDSAEDGLTEAGAAVARTLPPNSILVSCIGNLGKVGLNTVPVAFNQQINAILPNESKAIPEFLFYQVLSCSFKEQLEAMTSGTTVPIVNKSKFNSIEIVLPPLPEQQRIVGILDEAFEGIATAKANAEKNLQNARALFESHLQAVFSERGEGWVERTIGDVCDFLNGFAFKSEDAVPESETQLIRMGNLYGNKLSLDRNPAFYPDSFVEEYRRYILNEGDIIMSLTGTTGKEDYGYAVRVPDCEKSLLMNQRIVKFDSIREELVNRDFLLHYLRSRVFLDVLYPTANGTRQANLSSVTIKTLPIPLCSIGEQKRIASSLESLFEETQRLEDIYQQKLDALDALKKSLLDQAFTGQLTN